MYGLIARLSVPFIGVLIVVICVNLGSSLAKLIAYIKGEKSSEFVNDDSGFSSDSDESRKILLPDRLDEIPVAYPSVALISSLSISVVKFFYWGTSLAAHQYLFSVRQAHTHIQYAQNNPWMKYEDAVPLIMVSIPSILIFDFIIPVVFIIICWKVRNKLNTVKIYYGSLFDSYQPTCFWWELVSTLKKLSIALVLKGFLSSDAVQSALVVSIMIGTLMLQLTLHPWRRKVENYSDSASSLLLIAAFLFTRPSHHTNITGVAWYIFALSVAFIVFNVVIIVYQMITGQTDFERQQIHYISSLELGTQDERPYYEDWRSETEQSRSEDESTLSAK